MEDEKDRKTKEDFNFFTASESAAKQGRLIKARYHQLKEIFYHRDTDSQRAAKNSAT